MTRICVVAHHRDHNRRCILIISVHLLKDPITRYRVPIRMIRNRKMGIINEKNSYRECVDNTLWILKKNFSFFLFVFVVCSYQRPPGGGSERINATISRIFYPWLVFRVLERLPLALGRIDTRARMRLRASSTSFTWLPQKKRDEQINISQRLFVIVVATVATIERSS